MTPRSAGPDCLLERERIGSDSEPGFVLGAPASIAVDRRRNVYIADMASMTVKVYDEASRPLRRFGGRGRDPGQFLTIGPMCLVSSGELAIVDDARGALSYWSTDGEFLKELTLPEDAHNIGQIEPWGSDSLLLLYDQRKRLHEAHPNAPGLLLHQAGRDSLTMEAEFGSTELSYTGGEPGRIHGLSHPGSFASTSANEIVYCPAAYEGSLYRFRQANTASPWRFEDVLSGFPPSGPAFRQLPSGREPTSGAALTRYSRTGVQHFEVAHRNLGLFSTRGGSLIQFLRVRDEHATDAILMQTFSPDGELIHCRQSSIVTKELIESGLSHSVLAMDDQRHVYVVSRTPDWRVPIVRTFEMRLGDDARR